MEIAKKSEKLRLEIQLRETGAHAESERKTRLELPASKSRKDRQEMLGSKLLSGAGAGAVAGGPLGVAIPCTILTTAGTCTAGTCTAAATKIGFCGGSVAMPIIGGVVGVALGCAQDTWLTSSCFTRRWPELRCPTGCLSRPGLRYSDGRANPRENEEKGWPPDGGRV